MSSLHRRRMRRRRTSRYRRAGRRRLVGGAALAVVGGSLLAGGLVVHSVGQTLEKRATEIKALKLGQNTRIYAKDGSMLGVIAGLTNRTQVQSGQIPKSLKNATVAIEDKRFYDHHGVDYYRLVGAAVRDASGGKRQGGSTITMQVIKNLYEGGEERTLSRKVEEAYLAYQFEDKYSKDQILTSYLNGVPYGHNAVGVQAAALTYFGVPVARITLPQAALLAGLPQAPSAYDPFVNPQAARERRNLVLQEMADQGYITQPQADAAKKRGLALHKGRSLYTGPQHEGYFFEYVRNQLIGRYGKNAVQNGGFKVHTTIDRTLQNDAKQAIDSHLYLDDDPAAAIVMIDSRTGYIRAMQSNSKFGSDSQFNFATQAKRQAGSTFKTFVLTAAVEKGINPYSTSYISKPLDFYDPDWGRIEVATYSHSYKGRVSIANATLSSDNSVYTEMTLDLGPDVVVETAYRMGIPRARKLPVVASIGLGSGEVTPLDMATAYSPLSNGGYRVAPQGVQKIDRPGGRASITMPPKKTRVFSDGVAYEVTRVLHDNVTGGTGQPANIAPNIAGKTGTTSAYVDAWFVGYTPCYTTAVWMGYPNNTGAPRYMTSVHGMQVTGGSFPAQIWATFMKRVMANPDYKCDKSFETPTNPMSWTAFSSKFTREAAAAAASTQRANTGSTDTTDTTTGSTTSAAPDTTSQQPSPSIPEPPAPPPTPSTEAPAPTPTPAPTPAEPTTEPSPTPTPTPAPTP